MIAPLTVRGVTLGAGRAKIAVPIVGRTREEILAKAAELASLPADLAEWRADFYDGLGDEAALSGTLRRLREALGALPLLFTVRTECGAADPDDARYATLVRAAARSGCADLVDVELSRPNARALLDDVRGAGCRSVGSHHDFRATPPEAELLAYLREAQALGADVPKLAVTANSDADLLTLLAASVQWRDRYADRPFIAISMGHRGVLSRAACALTGSCVTFGAAGEASAPGQLPVTELARTLALLSEIE